MPWGLKHFQQSGQLHFLTFSCCRRRPNLATPDSRACFESSLERVRQSYGLCVYGYVVMPEHVHLLFSEPGRGDPSVVMKVLKPSFAHKLLARLRATTRPPSLSDTVHSADHIWQRRFYDFVVFNEQKRVEKLRYMHRNPVVRGLVQEPEQWNWSSYRHYALGEPGPVLVNQLQKAELIVRKTA